MSRRAYAIGLAVNFGVVVGASVAAYAGWLRHLHWRWLSTYDYFFHGLLIGPLAFFLDGALRFRPLTRRVGGFLPLAAVVVLSVAGIEELLQQLSRRRSTTLHDFVGDTVGVVFFTVVGRIILRRTSRGAKASDERRA
jgi:hypothetical protein